MAWGDAFGAATLGQIGQPQTMAPRQQLYGLAGMASRVYDRANGPGAFQGLIAQRQAQPRMAGPFGGSMSPEMSAAIAARRGPMPVGQPQRFPSDQFGMRSSADRFNQGPLVDKPGMAWPQMPGSQLPQPPPMSLINPNIGNGTGSNSRTSTDWLQRHPEEAGLPNPNGGGYPTAPLPPWATDPSNGHPTQMPQMPQGADIPHTEQQGDWDVTSGGFSGQISRRNRRTGQYQYQDPMTGQWVDAAGPFGMGGY
jgi:hypothetical protein